MHPLLYALGAIALWASLASLGLSLLMLCGLIVRIRVNDGLLVSLPALFFLLLNLYILAESLGWGGPA